MAYTTALGYTPVFRITKDTEDLTSNFSDRLVSIKVSSFSGGGIADQCSITLDDRDWAIGLPNVGTDATTLGIAMGFKETGMFPMGSFQIDRMVLAFAPKTITLFGNSVSMNSNVKAPLITSHADTTLKEVVGKIAFSAGVTASVDPKLGNLAIDYLNQHASSGHLLTNLERKYDGLATFADGQLAFTQRGTGQNTSGVSIGNVFLDPADIEELSIDINNRHSYSSVKASYWDGVQNKLVWLDSKVPGDSASSVPFMIKRASRDATEAQAAADAEMKARNRQGCTGSLTLAKGDASIRGGQMMSIRNCRPGITGDYFINVATHTLSKDAGLLTTLDFNSEEGAGAADGGDSTE